jgi:hypothetical protein
MSEYLYAEKPFLDRLLQAPAVLDIEITVDEGHR